LSIIIDKRSLIDERNVFIKEAQWTPNRIK
jgi:hypothetical protein